MNYIAEINSFWDSIAINPLSTGQVTLWFALMHINNKCNWIEWFTVPNQVLSVHTGLSRSGILKARNELKQRGLIDFKERGTKATAYKMVTMSNSTQDSMQDSTQNSVQNSDQDSAQNSNTLNKQKQKLKQKKDTNVSKESDPGKIQHKRGEYGHVLLSDDEIYRLSIDYDDQTVQAAIIFLDEYMQMKGKVYKDCNLAIRKWVISAVQKRQTKKAQPPTKPNQFHNFNQRDTDYDAMILQDLNRSERMMNHE